MGREHSHEVRLDIHLHIDFDFDLDAIFVEVKVEVKEQVSRKLLLTSWPWGRECTGCRVEPFINETQRRTEAHRGTQRRLLSKKKYK